MSITEKLIEKVKGYSILYDLSHEDYKNLRKKNKIWDQIGIELNEDGEQLKKKWKNLRDSYAKHLKNIKTTTGQSAIKNSYKKWQWAQQMEHFKPFLMFATTSTNITYTDNSQTSDAEKTQEKLLSTEEPEISEPAIETSSEVVTKSAPKEVTTPRNKKYEPKNKKIKIQTSDHENSSVKNVINYLENKRGSTKEPIDLIFQGYAQILKQFSPRRQAQTKLKIAEIMTEQELQHQEELLLKNQQNRPNSVSSASDAWSTDSTFRSSLVSPPMTSPLESPRYFEASQHNDPVRTFELEPTNANAASFFGNYNPLTDI